MLTSQALALGGMPRLRASDRCRCWAPSASTARKAPPPTGTPRARDFIRMHIGVGGGVTLRSFPSENEQNSWDCWEYMPRYARACELKG